jgi:hypothetical protein
VHTLLLAGALPWLAAQPLPIVVESHPAMVRTAAKLPAPTVPAGEAEIPLHGMRASIGADGRVHYQCEQAGSVRDLRLAPPVREEER